ncbi:MAG: glycosyltransferase family 4 protein [Nanoarchaeota archaeon]
MKILYLCEFSAGADGVWNRVYNIAKIISKRHEVYVFSSNITKGTEEIAKSREVLGGIRIFRFPVKRRVGENVLFWDFTAELNRIKPDVINTHVYRHPHSTIAPKLAKKSGAKCFLTTHAPFVEGELRSRRLNFLVNAYDKFIGKKILNSYNKVIAITKWEIPFLERMGCDRKKIVYIPNGIPDEFSKVKINYNKYLGKEIKILYFGRISPIKDLETLIKAISILRAKGHRIVLKLVGPAENAYKERLIVLAKDQKLGKYVKFSAPVYGISQKIKALRAADIFVLPSKREASPQALLEAMSLGLLVISSDTLGGKEILGDEERGLLFQIGDGKDLADKIDFTIRNFKSLEKTRKRAVEFARKLIWSKIAAQEESLY